MRWGIFLVKWWMDVRRVLNTYWGKPSIPHVWGQFCIFWGETYQSTILYFFLFHFALVFQTNVSGHFRWPSDSKTTQDAPALSGFLPSECSLVFSAVLTDKTGLTDLCSKKPLRTLHTQHDQVLFCVLTSKLRQHGVRLVDAVSLHINKEELRKSTDQGRRVV
jgi:hypothetical protein